MQNWPSPVVIPSSCRLEGKIQVLKNWGYVDAHVSTRLRACPWAPSSPWQYPQDGGCFGIGRWRGQLGLGQSWARPLSRCNFGRKRSECLISFYCHTVEALSGQTPKALQGRWQGRGEGAAEHEKVGRRGKGLLHREVCGALVPGQRWAWDRAVLHKSMAAIGWVHLHPKIYSKTWCLSGFSTEEIWEYIR